MIEITRLLARQVRAVLRRCVPIGTGRAPKPLLTLHADNDGLTIRAHGDEVAAEVHCDGARSPASLALPGEALDDFESSKVTPVVLEQTGSSVEARWDDAGVPQVREYTVAGKLPGFPAPPKAFAAAGCGLLQALDHAVQCAARENVRYAVSRLQLRGKTGEVVGTDGHQLFVQRGFTFPWQDDALIPALGLYGSRELARETEVEIGRTDKHVCLRVGPWTFWLAIDADGRFPDAAKVIPAHVDGNTMCRLTDEDAAFLAQALSRLPGRAIDTRPVTVDINGHVLVRARDDGQDQPTELELCRSEVTGRAVQFVTGRDYLARALAMGFTQLEISKADHPIVARDSERTYVWIPLEKSGAVRASANAVRISSDPDGQPSSPKPERREESVNHSKNNGKNAAEAPLAPASAEADVRPQRSPGNGKGDGHVETPTDDGNGQSHAHRGAGLGSLVAEAEAFKEALREAYSRAGRLVAAIKHQRKQSKLVSTALSSLASLRELQQFER